MDRTLSQLVQTFHLSASVPSASLWSRAAQWCLGACAKQGMLCKTHFSMLWCSSIAIYLCPQQPGAQCIYCVLRAFLKIFSAALQYKNVHSMHGRASMEFRMLLFLPCISLLFLACFNHCCSLILLGIAPPPAQSWALVWSNVVTRIAFLEATSLQSCWRLRATCGSLAPSAGLQFATAAQSCAGWPTRLLALTRGLSVITGCAGKASWYTGSVASYVKGLCMKRQWAAFTWATSQKLWELFSWWWGGKACLDLNPFKNLGLELGQPNKQEGGQKQQMWAG